MKVVLCGVQVLNFELNGEKVDGMKLFMHYVTPEVVGEWAGDVFVQREKMADIFLVDPLQYVGEEVNMDFNRKGKLVSLSAL